MVESKAEWTVALKVAESVDRWVASDSTWVASRVGCWDVCLANRWVALSADWMADPKVVLKAA